MIRRGFGLLLMLVLLMLCGCQLLSNAQQRDRAKEHSMQVLPDLAIPIPTTSFVFLFPETPHLDSLPSPRKVISEQFSLREQLHVAVSDPLLMAKETTMLIDLSQIQSGEFAFPLPGAKLISPYAGRRKRHAGVDLKTVPLDTIVSAFDGIVRLSKPYYAYGNIVVVRHYNGLETVYSHNTKNLVKPGMRVKAGDPIALVGRTGRATTEHLHFEVRINGQHFNPALVFDFSKRTLQRHCLLCTRKGSIITVKSIDLMPHQQQKAYDYTAVFR